MRVATCPQCGFTVELDQSGGCRVCGRTSGLANVRTVDSDSAYAKEVGAGTDGLIQRNQDAMSRAAQKRSLGATQHCLSCGGAMPKDAAFCPKCGVSSEEALGDPDAMQRAVLQMNHEISALRGEIRRLQEVVDFNASLVDEVSTRFGATGVLSDDFWKRAISIYGHVLAVGVPLALLFGLASYIFVSGR